VVLLSEANKQREANILRGTFVPCSTAVKTLYCLPTACQYMLANCGANTRKPV